MTDYQEFQKVVNNLVSQVYRLRDELGRQHNEQRRIYEQIDKVYQGAKELRREDALEIEGIRKTLEDLTHKELRRSTREQLILWLASGGAGSGIVSMLLFIIQHKK